MKFRLILIFLLLGYGLPATAASQDLGCVSPAGLEVGQNAEVITPELTIRHGPHQTYQRVAVAKKGQVFKLLSGPVCDKPEDPPRLVWWQVGEDQFVSEGYLDTTEPRLLQPTTKAVTSSPIPAATPGQLNFLGAELLRKQDLMATTSETSEVVVSLPKGFQLMIVEPENVIAAQDFLWVEVVTLTGNTGYLKLSGPDGVRSFLRTFDVEPIFNLVNP